MRFTAIDTAGVRRRKQVKDSIEFYSAARSRGAISRADVVVHLLDGPMEIGRLDRQLDDFVTSHYKPCVIAVNKVDLAPGITLKEWDTYVRDRLPGVAFAPLVCISAQTGQNVLTLIETAVGLHEQSFVRVATGELNRAIEEAVVAPAAALQQLAVRQDLLRHPGGGEAADHRPVRQRAGADRRELPALPGRPPARNLRLQRHTDQVRRARRRQRGRRLKRNSEFEIRS